MRRDVPPLRAENKGISPETVLIESAIKAIPAGKIATYGKVAAAAGLRNGARQVARVLHSRAVVAHLPWYRVLAKGNKTTVARIALAGDGFDEQRALLIAEGVAVDTNGCVDYTKFGYY